MKTTDNNQTKREHTHPKVSTGEKSSEKENTIYYIYNNIL
jgi:hypothetical protein